MKMILNNCENDLIFDNSKISTIEILNKKAFYNILKELNDLNNQDNIFFMENEEFVNIQSKITIIYDYVNFDFDSKKISNAIFNLINESVDENKKDEINKIYQKLVKVYNKVIGDIDISLSIQTEFSMQDITKLIKPQVLSKSYLLDNLLLLIDIESSFCLDKLLVLVNLKDYLENNELEELYKYAIYKEINILLVDNKQHITNKFEKKLLIDEDLVEFVL